MKKLSFLKFDIGNVGVRVSTGGFSNIGDKSGATVHSHADIEYHTVMRGRALIEIDGETVILSERDSLIILPDTFHKFLKNDGESAVLSFPLSLKENRKGTDYYSLASERLNRGDYILVRDNSLVAEWLERITSTVYSEDPFAKEEMRAYFSLIVLKLLEVLSSPDEGGRAEQEDYEYDTRAYIIEEYFNEHYMEKLSLSDLAERLYLSEKQTDRIVKRIFGTGFRDRLLKIRLKSALELLDETDLDVKTVAERVGYSSYNGFYATFKNKMGISPEQYRNKSREK